MYYFIYIPLFTFLIFTITIGNTTDATLRRWSNANVAPMVECHYWRNVSRRYSSKLAPRLSANGRSSASNVGPWLGRFEISTWDILIWVIAWFIGLRVACFLAAQAHSRLLGTPDKRRPFPFPPGRVTHHHPSGTCVPGCGGTPKPLGKGKTQNCQSNRQKSISK